ncbi:MAG: hypothetical protein DBY30_08795 [Verrucomicrobia bacterium]|nr:MAG: hypothetical protein DBY30_08795 [Verrucomicrobiota bacterium]
MGALAAYAPFLKESPACRAAARLGDFLQTEPRARRRALAAKPLLFPRRARDFYFAATPCSCNAYYITPQSIRTRVPPFGEFCISARRSLISKVNGKFERLNISARGNKLTVFCFTGFNAPLNLNLF